MTPGNLFFDRPSSVAAWSSNLRSWQVASTTSTDREIWSGETLGETYFFSTKKCLQSHRIHGTGLFYLHEGLIYQSHGFYGNKNQKIWFYFQNSENLGVPKSAIEMVHSCSILQSMFIELVISTIERCSLRACSITQMRKCFQKLLRHFFCQWWVGSLCRYLKTVMLWCDVIL